MGKGRKQASQTPKECIGADRKFLLYAARGGGRCPGIL